MEINIPYMDHIYGIEPCRFLVIFFKPGFLYGKKGKTLTYDTQDSYDSEVFGVFREAHLYHQAFQVPKMEVLAHGYGLYVREFTHPQNSLT